MPLQEKVLYVSENGDRWSLIRVAGNDRVIVRHQPNPPSGGQTSDMDVGEFLSRGGMGPEKQELLRLIRGLTDEVQNDGSGPAVA